MNRRTFIKAAAVPLGAPALARFDASAAMQTTARSSVVVVGGGAFGAWTALHLREMGHTVTLLDAYGPGNSRATASSR